MAMSVRVEREVPARPAAVWTVVTDLDHVVERLPGITRIERTHGSGYDVGTRWRETRRVLGQEASEYMEVLAVEPERSTTVASRANGADYRSIIALEPIDEGRSTRVTMTFAAESTSAGRLARLGAALTAPLGRAISRRAMRQDLDGIATAAAALDTG